MNEIATKDRLVETAERLFAEQGLHATSLRQITAEAGANLAAVNYHFHTKESLVREVLARRFVPLNRERLRRLDELQRDGRPTLEGILEAFLYPVAEAVRQYPNFCRFASRVQLEPDPELRTYFFSLFGEVIARFGDAVGSALPDLPFGVLAWRMHFLIGAMINSIVNGADVPTATGGAIADPGPEVTIRRLVEFGAAGLRAPWRHP